VESNAGSSYQSMQFRSERRVRRGLAFLASYTFSKSIDGISSIFGGSVGSGLPQDSQNLRGDHGLSDFNAAQRLPLSFLYDLQLRGEFFNSLNHPNFDIPSHTFDLTACAQNSNLLCPVENFGSILSANPYGNKPPRQIQLSAKYVF